MSDATVTILVAGIIQIVGMVIGFLTLWTKLQYASEMAKDAATKAALVKSDLEYNTLTTKSVEDKADTIVKQTDGALDALRVIISTVMDRVSSLETQNRERGHRLLDAINTLHLKVATLGCMVPAMQKQPEDTK